MFLLCHDRMIIAKDQGLNVNCREIDIVSNSRIYRVTTASVVGQRPFVLVTSSGYRPLPFSLRSVIHFRAGVAQRFGWAENRIWPHATGVSAVAQAFYSRRIFIESISVTMTVELVTDAAVIPIWRRKRPRELPQFLARSDRLEGWLQGVLAQTDAQSDRPLVFRDLSTARERLGQCRRRDKTPSRV